MNDTQQLENFGNISDYGWWLDNGYFIVYWSGNVLEDEQEIIAVYDYIETRWIR